MTKNNYGWNTRETTKNKHCSSTCSADCVFPHFDDCESATLAQISVWSVYLLNLLRAGLRWLGQELVKLISALPPPTNPPHSLSNPISSSGPAPLSADQGSAENPHLSFRIASHPPPRPPPHPPHHQPSRPPHLPAPLSNNLGPSFPKPYHTSSISFESLHIWPIGPGQTNTSFPHIMVHLELEMAPDLNRLFAMQERCWVSHQHLR